MIKKAQAEAQDIVAKSKEAGDNLRNEIERKAQEKADELIEKSNKQIESAKAKAVDELKSISVDLAIKAASKVLDKNLDDNANRNLAKSTINEAN
jgi:F-type H+-transporting ATPase subunit b